MENKRGGEDLGEDIEEEEGEEEDKKGELETIKIRNKYPDIRFSQRRITDGFTDGSSLGQGIEDIKEGKWRPVLEAVIFDKKLYSMDNRRLYCLRQAGEEFVRVRINKFNPRWHASKLTTTNDGQSVYKCAWSSYEFCI